MDGDLDFEAAYVANRWRVHPRFDAQELGHPGWRGVRKPDPTVQLMGVVQMGTSTVAAKPSARDTNAVQLDNSAIQQATENFYSAINAMFQGDIEPMKDVWSHADDITFLGPDGTVNVGWRETLDNLQNQAEMNLGGDIRHEQIMVTVGRDLATMECWELGMNVVGGKQMEISLRATNVFRKEDGVWKLIGHQTDKLPFMQK